MKVPPRVLSSRARRADSDFGKVLSRSRGPPHRVCTSPNALGLLETRSVDAPCRCWGDSRSRRRRSRCCPTCCGAKIPRKETFAVRGFLVCWKGAQRGGAGSFGVLEESARAKDVESESAPVIERSHRATGKPTRAISSSRPRFSWECLQRFQRSICPWKKKKGVLRIWSPSNTEPSAMDFAT